ncbi:hypothetical protein DFH08DRAFT_801278 [Mycena albidolilacea]|uniref:Uncharacterized protein n=1 Tax=Mycena albidolilacea TaxID=1033008 RepID=A0AAD7AIB6_9AGAR|nr:hypothetical protein DFH08DRAFT_801278 [Mycena albidolilacea]
MWRANGIGNLQVGEHQCSINFVILSTLMMFAMAWLVFSYDIACQYAIKFWECMGTGMTNGEGIEQNWAFSNGMAASTQLMGPGSRQATLKDTAKIFRMSVDNVHADHILPKRLAVAIKDGNQHQVVFEAFSKGLEEVCLEQIKEWRVWVERWESMQYITPDNSLFNMQEEGVEIECEHTLSTFIMMGLHIEESQQCLEVAIQKLDFTKHRTILLKRIHKFRELQTVYMPSVRVVLTNIQKQMYDGSGEELTKVTQLFMLSEIANPRVWERVCAMGLPTIEARLHEAEVVEALESVIYKLRNYTGQGLMAKGQGILHQINIHIHIAKLRYRYSQAALVVLRGHGDWEECLCMLSDEDIRGLNECALTSKEKAQKKHWADIGGAIIEEGIVHAAGVASEEGSHTPSWI